MSITEYIRRWWQRKGFGIQSKTDYAFLHDVVRETHPYYAYEEWQRRYPDAPPEEHALARLLLRIANSLQPATARIHGNHTPLIVEAINSGCRRTAVEESDTPYFRLWQAMLPAKAVGGPVIEFITDKAAHHSTEAMVLTHIHTNNAHLWRQLLDGRAITYDMRHTGIAIIRQDRYPEHYQI